MAAQLLHPPTLSVYSISTTLTPAIIVRLLLVFVFFAFSDAKLALVYTGGT